MNAIRHIRSAVRPSFVVSNGRLTASQSVATHITLACRWHLGADGRLTCAWERVALLPRRRPAPVVVSTPGRPMLALASLLQQRPRALRA